ncbi:uncharacterized protein LOC143041730 [Oratosquilla oratoria]|uniref:uncharacterized protein LOC143041730 n=1 Tax=Oratosquilla oratoria TaxID=337810 RepID=UPI003F775EB1
MKVVYHPNSAYFNLLASDYSCLALASKQIPTPQTLLRAHMIEGFMMVVLIQMMFWKRCTPVTPVQHPGYRFCNVRSLQGASKRQEGQEHKHYHGNHYKHCDVRPEVQDS